MRARAGLFPYMALLGRVRWANVGKLAVVVAAALAVLSWVGGSVGRPPAAPHEARLPAREAPAPEREVPARAKGRSTSPAKRGGKRRRRSPSAGVRRERVRGGGERGEGPPAGGGAG